MTLFCSKSQHLTILSSPAEKRYGCRGDTASPRTVDICPVSDSLSSPDAKSQIYACGVQRTEFSKMVVTLDRELESLTLISLSPAPVANHWLPGSTVTARTHPKCPELTLESFH